MSDFKTKNYYHKKMNQKAQIDYPTSWTYKIIAHCQEDIHSAVKTCLGSRHRNLTISNKSSQGRFVSMELSLVVQSNEDREGIFHALFKEKGIKMVL